MKENTENRLIEAGWYEKRSISINEIITIYEERGFKLSDGNKLFIKKYGLLEFELLNANSLFQNKVYKHFNPIKALGKNLYKRSLEYLEDEYDIDNIDTVIPIGENDNGNMLILCTENNMFYGYTDGCLVKYGSTIEEMLDCIVGENTIPQFIE